MSFLNPDKENSVAMKIHTRSYSWSGGEKAINPQKPEEGKKAYAQIRFYEGSGQNAIKGVADAPTMKIAVIGQTFQVTGFDSQGSAATNVSYFSNETTAWGQPLKVYKRDARGSEVIATGSYKEVKDKLGKLIKCQHNVYFYDFERKCIDRFTFSGSSYGAWTDYKKSAGKGVYTGFTIIEPGQMEVFPTGPSILPKFSLPATYTDAERAEVVEVATKMDEYEAYLEERANKVDDDGDGFGPIDQTPAQYDGEGSQELPDASTAQPAPAANTTDLGVVPF